MKEKSLQRSLVRIGIVVALLLLSALVIWLRGRENAAKLDGYSVEVIPPTCTDGGYSLYTDPETGKVIMDDIVPATGHSFADWQTDTEPTPLIPGSRSRTCKNCGTREQEAVCYNFDIPAIVLEGSLDGIGKKDEVNVQARIITADGEIASCATLKYQGHSSLYYPKKNYTLKLWENAERTKKNEITFSHWNKENKYILKADYIDPTMCRNLICADVWAAVTESRKDLPAELAELSNYGAVDGFPTVLYINGVYQGLYNMNLHKDDDLFGMSENAPHAIMIANDPTAEEAFFKAEAVFAGNSPWEVEFCGTEDADWAKKKLNKLITFVMESDDETFRKALSNHLDVDSAIDYLLSLYVLGLTNHGADELILVCYDTDSPWVASMYDMETGFGLSADGKTFRSAEKFLPVLHNGQWDSGTENLLWDRLLQNFYPEMAARYAELRRSVFDPENLTQRVTDFTGSIPRAMYEANDAIHEGFPASDAGIAQIKDYIKARIQLTDKLFLTNEG